MCLRASCLTILIGTSACGGHAPPPAVPFDAIQRDEARAARGSAVVDSAQSCAGMQAGADEACHARSDLCERVRGSADADAQARCLRASDMCISARARSDAKCAESPSRAVL